MNRRETAPCLLAVALACTPTVEAPDGMLDQGVLGPFPSRQVFDEERLAVPAGVLPQAATPFPVERQAWRTGVSVAQVFVLRLDDVDPAALPGWAEARSDGAVRIIDTVTGAAIPCFAELDAHPDAAEAPALLIRPLTAMASGHEHLIVVDDAVTPRPEAFTRWLATHEDADALSEAVSSAGLNLDDLALAWTVPVDDGTRPLATANALPRPQPSWVIDDITDQPDLPRTWRQAEGRFTVTNVLAGAEDQQALVQDETGATLANGEGEALLWVHIPASIADAPAGSRPVLLFGHGFLADPPEYLRRRDDKSAVLALADEMGAVVVAAHWQGLSFEDRLHAIDAARDFGRLPELTDLLVQAQVNTLTLAHLVTEGGLLDDPALAGAQGQRLGDPDRLVYYGISLGGIEGAVLSAQADSPLIASVLQVPGGFWSTMLERSMHWNTFEPLVNDTIEDPFDRQLLYAASQWFWDAVDPAAWAPRLDGRLVLLQESYGDEQVPNLTTRALARSAGLPQLFPAVEAVPGLAIADLGAPGSAYVQLDPEKAMPPVGNRPSPRTEAHDLPRAFPGTLRQILDFLDTASPGTRTHACGDAPCSASNPGPPLP
jgi:hypothetical protein